ncbi:hypothetical protein RSAG8_01431, partial [Rhizoctonia solani AG-8 WAC10335]
MVVWWMQWTSPALPWGHLILANTQCPHLNQTSYI